MLIMLLLLTEGGEGGVRGRNQKNVLNTQMITSNLSKTAGIHSRKHQNST